LFGRYYGDAYKVAAPSAPGGQWTAIALFAQQDELSEWSPEELLDELMHHRCRNGAAPEAGQ
jgi:hypothetical protein